MARRFICLFVLLFPFLISSAQNGMTPVKVLDRVSYEIAGSKGIVAKFTVINGGFTNKGEIVTQDKKFKIKLPEAEIWYNGKDLYTYNENTEETTIVKPTPEELAESNPLAYVTAASQKYNVIFSTVKKPGYYVLELTPKVKNPNLKRVTLTINKKDFLPERIVVEPVSGNPVRADINSFKKGVTVSSTEFEYPESKFPKAEIIDLR